MSPSYRSKEEALQAYEKRIKFARDQFAVSKGISRMISPEIDSRSMLAFLLYFSATSVSITLPVEDWIRRSGEMCSSQGLNDIAKALLLHSQSEANHHQYHINDYYALAEFWNARYFPPLESDFLEKHQTTNGGARYCEIHEQNIASSSPYCQFAIEYEIELLPVLYGNRFVQNCVRLLGEEILKGMTFSMSHIKFDVAHSKFNAAYIGRLIIDDPDRLESLVAIGTETLNAFGGHLTECMDAAENLSKIYDSMATV